MTPPPTAELPVETHLRSVAERVEAELRRLLAARSPGRPRRLWEAMGYALLSGGKRLRPALVLASAEAHGGGAGDDSLAMRFAVALEAVHTYSLVHDDLPCMDDDDLRRGRATVHRAFDEATAVLVGDGLQSLAFAHVLEAGHPASGPLARLLAENALLMVDGQARDIAGEHAALPEVEVMELMRTKTGALLATAVAGGALAAGAEAGPAYAMGLKLGLAFQITDDLLDLGGDTASLGKRAGKDADAGKSTLPALVGAEEARRRAEALCDEALRALAPAGARAAPLRALARFVLSRRS